MAKRRAPVIPSHPPAAKRVVAKPEPNPAAEGPQQIATPVELAIQKFRSIVVAQSEQIFDQGTEIQRLTQFNVNANVEIERLRAEVEKLTAKASSPAKVPAS